MKIITCIKQVPGTNKVEIDPITGTLKRDSVASKMNPYDLFALETAFQIVESAGGEVATISMGPPQAKSVLEESLWMGADRAVLLSDRAFGGADVAATSYCLSLGIKKMGVYDLILCGKQTTDGDTAQVGPELAEQLGIEHAANVIEIEDISNCNITVKIDLDGSVQTIRMAFPCLLTLEKDINTPRLPSYLRKKATTPDQIEICSLKSFPDADVGRLGSNGSPTQVERIFSPKARATSPLLFGSADKLSDDLYRLLRSEKYI